MALYLALAMIVVCFAPWCFCLLLTCPWVSYGRKVLHLATLANSRMTPIVDLVPHKQSEYAPYTVSYLLKDACFGLQEADNERQRLIMKLMKSR